MGGCNSPRETEKGMGIEWRAVLFNSPQKLSQGRVFGGNGGFQGAESPQFLLASLRVSPIHQSSPTQ